jgi:protein-tyrosine kinase
MDDRKESNPKQPLAGADAMVESSEQLVKTAVLEHRKREQIKNMAMPGLWDQDELYERKVVFAGMRQRELLNAFREVRIRLLKKSKSDNVVTLVSSVTNVGGSSFFAFNLAAVFALDQHKTALYVDCNPYSSAAERYITTPVDVGLTHYLTDYSIPLKRIIYPSGVERLRVIPSGGSSESAAEFFNSKRMEVLVAEIKARYPDRFIVLDAPSVQQSTEARILAQYCDHALLVVPFGKAVTAEVLAAIDAVGRERFAGLVFNH